MKNGYFPQVNKRVYKVTVPDFSYGLDSKLDERILPLNRAQCSYNFDDSSGALKEGYGIDFTDIPDAKSVWEYVRYDAEKAKRISIFMYCSVEGYIYYKAENQPYKRLSDLVYTSAPFAVNYRLEGSDVIILCSPTDRMVVWDGQTEPYDAADSPLVTSFAMHYERMFVTTCGERNMVWFSDDLNPTNWSPNLEEGGFIQLLDERGNSNRVVSYNNYIYVFREYGISRIAAIGDQKNFSVSNLFVSSGKIYADTVTVCGDVILFMASDGIYSFDGLSTRKILKNLEGLINGGGYPTACFFGGKYIVSFCAAFDDETDFTKNNCLLIMDRHSGKSQLMRGADVRTLNAFSFSGEKLYLVTGTGKVGLLAKSGKIFGINSHKVWQSGLTDFSHPDKQKLIKEIFIDTEYDIVLWVITEAKTKKFNVKGKSGISCVRANVTGSKIRVRIETEGEKASLAKPLVSFTLLPPKR